MEEMDGSVCSAIWVGLGGREMLNFEGSGCMDVSGKELIGKSVYWE